MQMVWRRKQLEARCQWRKKSSPIEKMPRVFKKQKEFAGEKVHPSNHLQGQWPLATTSGKVWSWIVTGPLQRAVYKCSATSCNGAGAQTTGWCKVSGWPANAREALHIYIGPTGLRVNI